MRFFRVEQCVLGSSLVLLPGSAWACPRCATSEEVWSQIVSTSPGAVIGIITLAFGIVAALIIVTARLLSRARLLLGGSLLLGAGLGAFLDGIVLHQVLQWHAMISSSLPPADLVTSKVNMFWDGIFHLYAWIASLVALVLVLRELPKVDRALRGRAVAGAMLAGWGYFNLVEGTIDHQLFGLHHVHPGTNQLAWDVGFLVLGALLVASGGLLTLPILRRAEVPSAPRDESSGGTQSTRPSPVA